MSSEERREQVRAAQRRYRARHPERVKAQAREHSRTYYRKNRDRLIADRKQRAYGLTADELAALLAAAPSCAICAEDFGERGPQIDHCHDTGRIRGVLCSSCNGGMGLLRDDPGRLRAAADYLEAP